MIVHAYPIVPRLGAGSGSGSACPIFPADNVWHADISGLPVNASSPAWIANMNPGAHLHPDWGDFNPDGYGIPVNAVPAAHAQSSSIAFQYAGETDPGPYFVGADLRIEGGPRQPSGGDQHMLALDTTNCRLQELFSASLAGAPYSAGSGAKWDLRSNALRPDGWTSADAAGLPILPGLVQFDEVVTRGVIDHAIRFTVNRTDRSHIWPARHDAGRASDPSLPPMGARFRLKASFDITGYDPLTQVVLKAMKKYGVILADNGSDWYFQGTSDDRWAGAYRSGTTYMDRLVTDFRSLTGADFEAVDESGLMVDPNSGAAR